MNVPKTEDDQKAAVDHAYKAIGDAVDLLRAKLDYGWLRRKLWGGYRITAEEPTGPDPAWTFDCVLVLDGQPCGLAISVPCMEKAVLVADGKEISDDPEYWYPVVKSRMQP